MKNRASIDAENNEKPFVGKESPHPKTDTDKE
jgi:hypothetical protein